MEPPPVAARYISQNSSRKRVFTGGSSSVMDSEVTEIPPPPVFQTRKLSKQKQVIVYEVIDIDSDEDSVDVIVLDEKVETRNKGKAVKVNSDGSGTYEPKESPMSSASGSNDVINLDCYDDHYGDLDDNLMDIEDYAFLQAYFDSVNIPAGVEAPVPWLSDPTFRKNKTVNESNSSSMKPASVNTSSLQCAMNVLGHSSDMDISSSGLPQQSAHGNKSAAFQDIPSAQYLSLDSLLSTSSHLGQYYQGNDNSVASAGGDLSLWTHGTLASVQEQAGTSSLFYSGSPVHKDAFNFPPGVEVESSMPWWSGTLKPGMNSTFVNYATHPSFYDPLDAVHIDPEEPADISPNQDCARNKISVDHEEILRKFKSFKQFDTVEDPSDHHYASKSTSMKQPSKNWVKRIQEEWKMLENDLPDTIFVRVYESRMDILRAVIVGAEGTPYHDGLFFFDVFFPGGYPNVPPLVYYHSGGLRLNPNLYACGKVCLSLLNTWSGDKNEKWIPSVSTMLQVLVSIQALILNEKPYFNEPGWACMSGTPNGEIESQKYNENTFIFSLKTMVYTMRRPPKHFKDFVVGHFYMHAHDILNACKTYMDGAQVGCLVKGGVPKLTKSRKSHSKQFRDSLAVYLHVVVEELAKIGAKDCEKFLSQTNRGVPGVGNMPKAAT